MANRVEYWKKLVTPESPLSTKELRDSLARRPLGQYNARYSPTETTNDFPKQLLPNEDNSSTLVNQMTSSPVNNVKRGQWSSPHLSMIRSCKVPEKLSPSPFYKSIDEIRSGSQSAESAEEDTKETEPFLCKNTPNVSQSSEKSVKKSTDKVEGSKNLDTLIFLLVCLISLGLAYWIGLRV